MTNTNVKPYSDAEIFQRAKQMANFKRTSGLPLLVAIRSNEDQPDTFDDKFYVYSEQNEFVAVTSGTTNSGVHYLKNFQELKVVGTGVIKSNELYAKGYKKGLHQGKMPCMRQNVPFKYFRDANRNLKAEEIGKLLVGNIAANFHTVDYNIKSAKVGTVIGKWSAACMVANDVQEYTKILAYLYRFIECDFLILQEW
jgi:hypothetical protein